MTDLESFANQFKAWKGKRRHVRYPKKIWEDIQFLAKKYPLVDIAKAYGIPLPYLRKKVSSSSNPMQFARVEVQSQSLSASVEFLDSRERPVTIRLHTSPCQIVHIIRSLQGEP